MNAPPDITDADLKRLDAFLGSEHVPESAMDVATLEGFLTALVIGPHVVMPSAWMPWVWDFERGEQEVEFADMAQARETMGRIMGLMNRIAGAFARDPAAFEPVFSAMRRGARRSGAKASSPPRSGSMQMTGPHSGGSMPPALSAPRIARG